MNHDPKPLTVIPLCGRRHCSHSDLFLKISFRKLPVSGILSENTFLPESLSISRHFDQFFGHLVITSQRFNNTYTQCHTDTPYRQDPNFGEDNDGFLGPKKDKHKVCSLHDKAHTNFWVQAAEDSQFCQALRYQNVSKGLVWHYINIDAMNISIKKHQVG